MTLKNHFTPFPSDTLRLFGNSQSNTDLQRVYSEPTPAPIHPIAPATTQDISSGSQIPTRLSTCLVRPFQSSLVVTRPRMVHSIFHLSRRRRDKVGVAVSGSVGLEVGPSTGPDPTVFRDSSSQDGVGRSVEASISSTSVGRENVATATGVDLNNVVSTGDHNPTVLSSRSRNLVRKLSAKGRKRSPPVDHSRTEPPPSAGPKALRTLGELSNIAPSTVKLPLKDLSPGDDDIFDRMALHPSRTTKAAAFTSASSRAKRMSLLQHSPSLSRNTSKPSSSSGDKTIPFPTTPTHASDASAAQYRTVAYRQSESPGSHPHRASSVKSSRRAEREWRARLAALTAANSSPRVSSSGSMAIPIQLRGPVPPKRTIPKTIRKTPNGNSGTGRSQGTSSPDTPALITPPHITLGEVSPTLRGYNDDDDGHDLILRTPAKSFVSGKSFATLGHHVSHSPQQSLRHLRQTSTEGDRTPVHLRRRKPSVPASINSFYDETNERNPATSRPNSLIPQTNCFKASTQINSPIVESESPNLPMSPQKTTPHTPTKMSERQMWTLPPFESFLHSPGSVERLLLLKTDARKDVEVRRRDVPDWLPASNSIQQRRSLEVIGTSPDSSHRKDRSQSLPADLESSTHPTETKPNTTSGQGSLSSLPHHVSVQTPRKGLTLDFLPIRTAPSTSPSKEPLHSATTSVKESSTPNTIPHTPCSPVTAFILSAPSIERLAWKNGMAIYGNCESDGSIRASRLFGSGRSAKNSENTNALKEGPVKSHNHQESLHPFAVSRGEDEATSSLPPTPPSKSPLKPVSLSRLQHQDKIRYMNPPNSPSPLQSSMRVRQTVQAQVPSTNRNEMPSRHHRMKKPQTSVKVDIIGVRHEEGGIRVKEQLKGFDLTPGMENGNRPPKSGLPLVDLERWLQNTSLGEAP